LGTVKLLKKLQETGTTAKQSGRLESIQISCCFIFLFIHKLDIIRRKSVICLQIFSAAMLPSIIKIGQHLTE